MVNYEFTKNFNSERKYFNVCNFEYRNTLNITNDDIILAVLQFEKSPMFRIMYNAGFYYKSGNKFGTLSFLRHKKTYNIYITGVIRNMNSTSPTRLKNAAVPCTVMSNIENILQNYKSACAELLSKRI